MCVLQSARQVVVGLPAAGLVCVCVCVCRAVGELLKHTVGRLQLFSHRAAVRVQSPVVTREPVVRVPPECIAAICGVRLLVAKEQCCLPMR